VQTLRIVYKYYINDLNSNAKRLKNAKHELQNACNFIQIFVFKTNGVSESFCITQNYSNRFAKHRLLLEANNVLQPPNRAKTSNLSK
jgi:hypothetical protein